MELAQCDAVGNLVKTDRLCGTETLLALQLRTLVGYLSGFLLRFHHVERVAGSGRSVQTEDDGRLGRTGRFNALVALVEHGLDLTPSRSCDDHVAYLQCAVADEHG